jgi:hypothetical protein
VFEGGREYFKMFDVIRECCNYLVMFKGYI